MKPINPYTAGLIKNDCYQEPVEPVNAAGEILLAATKDELDIIIEAVGLFETQTYREAVRPHNNQDQKVSVEESANAQVGYRRIRAERTSALLGQLRTLSNNPDVPAFYSQRTQ